MENVLRWLTPDHSAERYPDRLFAYVLALSASFSTLALFSEGIFPAIGVGALKFALAVEAFWAAEPKIATPRLDLVSRIVIGALVVLVLALLAMAALGIDFRDDAITLIAWLSVAVVPLVVLRHFVLARSKPVVA